jgi:hypothetical protein
MSGLERDKYWQERLHNARRWSAAWKATAKREKQSADYWGGQEYTLRKERDEARRWVRRLWWDRYKPTEMEPDQERALGKLSDAIVLEYLMRRFSHSNDFEIGLIARAQKLKAERDEARQWARRLRDDVINYTCRIHELEAERDALIEACQLALRHLDIDNLTMQGVERNIRDAISACRIEERP